MLEESNQVIHLIYLNFQVYSLIAFDYLVEIKANLAVSGNEISVRVIVVVVFHVE
jgi:hypothetical protein